MGQRRQIRRCARALARLVGGLKFHLAFVSRQSVATLLLWSGRKRQDDPVPFGPFLALDVWSDYLYGAKLKACLRAALS